MTPTRRLGWSWLDVLIWIAAIALLAPLLWHVLALGLSAELAEPL